MSRHEPGEYFDLDLEGSDALVHVYGHVTSHEQLDGDARDRLEGLNPANLRFEHFYTKKVPPPRGDSDFACYQYVVYDIRKEPGPRGWFPFTVVKYEEKNDD